jgi:hypothetical protein
MGEVYRARDHKLERGVPIKLAAVVKVVETSFIGVSVPGDFEGEPDLALVGNGEHSLPRTLDRWRQQRALQSGQP